ncbi:MAG: CHAT domain-containing protein [bacterium]|nr:CHAT domain-containing protein [bacterium]
MFDNLADSEALTYSRQLRDASDFYLSLQRELPDSVFAQSLDFAQAVMSSKEIVTDGLLTRSRVLRELDSHDARPLLDSLADLRSTLSVLYRSGNRGDSIAQTTLAHTISEIEQLQRKLAELSSTYVQGKDASQVSLGDVSAALPDSATLIEYYKYTHTNKLDQRSARYAAVIISRSGLVANVDLGPAEPIDAAARTWIDDFAAPQMLNKERTSRLSAKLQALIWDCVAKYFEMSKLILISPDGALSGVAFQALKGDDNRFLIEHSAIHYLSSARDVLHWSNGSVTETSPLLLTFADPDFSHTRASTTLAALPGTRIEIEQVAQSWKTVFSGSVQSFFGKDAISEAFTKNAPRAHMIYIASHGDCGALDSLQDQELSLTQQSLLLAGDVGTGDDGVVTAAEISQLDLANTNLVVLSACETASGIQIEGEGTLNLRRAFQFAGAHAVLSTLWSVDDSSTADLMSSLFARRDLTLPAALRKATVMRIEALRMQNDELGDHPYRWAGMCSSGSLRM